MTLASDNPSVGHSIGEFIRKVSPGGLQALDKLCDVFDKLALSPTDPRVAAALGALRAGCEARKRFGKGA